ncbi:hypothetical protein CASFOL_004196 [Castilleja foliolosa]|uniref:Uncharacterized protein n=1 Tax=Castilleja foliolosa TaxID=1961234 RepID=A0ABD3EAI3_9LAMI
MAAIVGGAHVASSEAGHDRRSTGGGCLRLLGEPASITNSDGGEVELLVIVAFFRGVAGGFRRGDASLFSLEFRVGFEPIRQAVTKGMTTVAGMANSTKPNALEAIRAKLVPLGVDPEPIIANCSQAFDAFVQARMSSIQLLKESSAYDPASDFEDDDDHFIGCKKELLNKANLSLPEIDQFDPEKSINTIITTIVYSKYAH